MVNSLGSNFLVGNFQGEIFRMKKFHRGKPSQVGIFIGSNFVGGNIWGVNFSGVNFLGEIFRGQSSLSCFQLSSFFFVSHLKHTLSCLFEYFESSDFILVKKKRLLKVYQLSLFLCSYVRVKKIKWQQSAWMYKSSR